MKKIAKRGQIGKRFLSASVISVFILCDRMLESGKEFLSGGWRGTWVSAVTAFAFAFLIFPFLSVFLDIVIGGEKRSWFQKSIKIIFSLAVGAAAVWVAVSAALKGTELVAAAMDINKNAFFITLVFLLVAAYTASSGKEAVKKFSLATLTLSLICAAALLILSAGRGGTEKLRPLISRSALAEGAAPESIKLAFFSFLAPAVVGVAWLSATVKRKAPSVSAAEALIGLLSGGATLAICFFTVVFSQGTAYASTQNFPYLSSVGSLTAGRLFMRPEGAVWVVGLMSVFAVLSVCISLIGLLIDGGRSKKIPFAAATVIGVACCFLL